MMQSLDRFIRSLAYAVRVLWRTPTTTLLVVGILAIGIGTNAGVFTLANAVLLEALPVDDAQSLYFVDVRGERTQRTGGSSYPLYQMLRSSSTQLQGLAAFQATELRIAIEDRPDRAAVDYVSGNLLQLLGVRATAGRTLTDDDDRVIGAGGADGPVTVISHRFWQQRFAGRADIIGRTIRLGDRAFRIVGVIEPAFTGLQPGRSVDMLVPLAWAPPRALQNTSTSFLTLIGRLTSNNDVRAAEAELQAHLASWRRDAAISSTAQRDYLSHIMLTEATRGSDVLRRRFTAPLLVLAGMVGLILLLTCANVASLLLTRAAQRQAELSTRLALGATRADVFGQMAIETALLAIAGTAMGVPAGWATIRVLLARLPEADPHFFLDVSLDPAVMLFATTVAALTTVLCGLVPAMWSARVAPAQALRRTSRSVIGGYGRFAGALVVGQIALTLVLLTAGGMLVRTLQQLHAVPKGFEPAGVVTARLDAGGAGLSEARLRQMWPSLLADLSALPGTEAAALSNLTPLGAGQAGAIITIPEFTARTDQDLMVARNEVSSAYFAVLGIPVRAGRAFSGEDRESGAPVAILNETAARFYFGGSQQAIGRVVRFGRSATTPTVEIVGVVRDTLQHSLREAPPRLLYIPLAQALEDHTSLTLSVRTAADLRTVLAGIRERAPHVSKDILVTDARTLPAQIDESLRQERTLAILGTIFGCVAVAVAALGVYGLVSQVILRRTNELGLRIAMGATPAVAAMVVVRHLVPLYVAGALLGLVGAAMVGRLMAHQLFDVPRVDPLSMFMAMVAFAAIAAMASAIPLRRALRLDPVTALRADSTLRE